MTITEIIKDLGRGIDRAEFDEWTVLCYRVTEGTAALAALQKASAALSQASFALRTLMPHDSDAKATVKMIEGALTPNVQIEGRAAFGASFSNAMLGIE